MNRNKEMTGGRRPKKRSGIYWFSSFLILLVALILPALAVLKAIDAFGIRLVGGYLTTVLIITPFVYRSDKDRAQKGLWRTPESTLHFLELIGGWGAAFVSQRVFRHKISKRAYQISFWMIALVHNYASFDYLNDWHFSNSLYQSVRPFLNGILQQ